MFKDNYLQMGSAAFKMRFERFKRSDSTNICEWEFMEFSTNLLEQIPLFLIHFIRHQDLCADQ